MTILTRISSHELHTLRYIAHGTLPPSLTPLSACVHSLRCNGYLSYKAYEKEKYRPTAKGLKYLEDMKDYTPPQARAATCIPPLIPSTIGQMTRGWQI